MRGHFFIKKVFLIVDRVFNGYLQNNYNIFMGVKNRYVING